MEIFYFSVCNSKTERDIVMGHKRSKVSAYKSQFPVHNALLAKQVSVLVSFCSPSGIEPMIFEQCLKKTAEMVSRGIPNQPLHHEPLQQSLFMVSSEQIPKQLWLYVVVEKSYKISWESISSPIQLRGREAGVFKKRGRAGCCTSTVETFFVVKFFHFNRTRSRKSSDFEKLFMGSFGNSGSLYHDRIHQQKV